MDLCNKCEEKQKWLLDNDDGTQVVCTCDDRFSEECVEESVRDDDGEDGEVDVSPTSTLNVGVQTPKRMATSLTTVDAPQRKKQRMDRTFWMNPGRDIRRHLFRDHDWEKLDVVRDKTWAILKVENIAISPSHRCIRRFYLGDNDGRNYLELEFYPCIPYKDLDEGNKELFHRQKSREHGLSYNPIRRALPCKMAIEKINDFIVYNGIQIILYNGKPGASHGRAEYEMCKTLGIQSLNIYGTSDCVKSDCNYL